MKCRPGKSPRAELPPQLSGHYIEFDDPLHLIAEEGDAITSLSW